MNNFYRIHVSTRDGRTMVPITVSRIDYVVNSTIVLKSGTKILTDYSPNETALLVRCAQKKADNG